MEIRNVKYTKSGLIDMEINHPNHGWVSFTATPDDIEDYGRELYAKALAGDFGDIAPYVPQTAKE
jgi:hypothetical protein